MESWNALHTHYSALPDRLISLTLLYLAGKQ